MNCCTPMTYAIENEYLEELHSYTDNKVRFTIGIYVSNPDRSRPPVRLNLCPWCGSALPHKADGGEHP